MDLNEEGDSIFPRKSSVFDKGKAPNGSFSSAKSESEIELFPSFSQPSMGSNPFSPRESFFEDTTADLSRVSIGFSAPLSSSEPVFSFKLEPSAEVDLDPMVEIDLPQPLECLQGQLVPPFLWKTFDIVEDPALDPIVSWGSTGQSFVVWDPVEFSRVILPSNFKHNNFSSFIRQLNTYVGIAVRQPLRAAVLYTKKYSHLPVTFVKGIENFHLHQGFRKIDTDKWEFANEAFQRGKRQLLKNIQRRKSPHSQPVGSFMGSSTEEGKLGIEDEIGRLKKERSMLMKEVVELQHQHKGTAQHMDIVSRRLQSAEQRQKQMISFLAKFLQNPAFLARLRKKKEQKAIGSPRVKRKFVKQHPHEMDEFKQSTEGQIVKYQPDWKNLTISSTAPDLNPDMLEDSTYLLQGMSRELGSIKESMSFQLEKASTGDVIVSEELALHHGTTKTAEDLRVEASNMTNEDQFFKGKSIDSTPQEFHPNYFISLTEDFPHFSPSGIGSVELDTIWSADMNFDAGMSSLSNELWNNQVDYEDPLLQVTSGLPPFWDLGSLQAGGSGTDKWSADEFPFDEPDSRAYPSKDDDSKNTKS